MRVYVQSSEDVFSGCTHVVTGYSDAVPEGKNTSDTECIRNVDLIRRHYYPIGAEASSPTGNTLQFAPDDLNHHALPHRGFLIQQDNSTGTAPPGYLVPSRAMPQNIANGDKKRLRGVRYSIRDDSIKRRSYTYKWQLV